MHRLLMERGEIIDRLIAVKKTQEIRLGVPARARGRHDAPAGRAPHGILPLDTVESIWRVIIATFTYVQAPFSVHADLSAGDAAMRDSARFHFGFTVPFVPHMGAAGVVAAVSESKGDLGLVPAVRRPQAPAPGGPRSKSTSAPKIIARLPFVERPDHPAALPVFVISRAARRRHGDRGRGLERAGLRLGRRGGRAPSPPLAEVIAVPDRAFDGAALLVSVPAGRRPDGRSTTALVKAGASVRSAALVGSHATRYTVPAEQAVKHSDRIVTAMTATRPAAAPRRARHRRLCAGQEHRARRRQGVQAVVERDAARAEPEGDRGLQRGRHSIWRTIRTAPPPRCARRSAAPSASIPDRIICGAGSDDLLNLLARAYLADGDEAIHTTHGFLIYPIATLGTGAKPVVAPEKNYTADVDAILKRGDAEDQDRLPRQSEQSDRHLSAVRRGQAAARGLAAACAARARRGLCRIRHAATTTRPASSWSRPARTS